MKFQPPNKKFVQLYQRFLFRLAGGAVLLLTTRGRRTGKPHTVGLQYELIDGKYYVGAADGQNADWYRNLAIEPGVKLQVGEKQMDATAELIGDPARIADFLEYRQRKRPLMIRMILRMDGIKGKLNRSVLMTYAEKIRLVILTPGKANQV